MNLTEEITTYILKQFAEIGTDEEDQVLQIRRKDLADHFDCVPSQINYVLRSRFNPERGFLVSSQRGGNGYIKITKCNFATYKAKLDHAIDIVDKTSTRSDLDRTMQLFCELGYLSNRERLLLEIAMKHLTDLTADEFDMPPWRRQQILIDHLKRVLRGVISS